MNKKHAYLIIAHGNFKQLQLLVSLLDDVRNDIYIHIDKKTKILPKISVKFSNLYILRNRIKVYWGDASQIKSELLLFEESSKKYRYEYYHLLSGIDLPLKSNDYIHDFFLKHKGREFILFIDSDENLFYERVLKYNLFTKFYRINNKYLLFIVRCLRFLCELIINWIFTRKQENIVYKKGANWVSITDDFVKLLLANKDIINERYKYTHCADEIYKQTLLWNSHLVSNISSLGNLRYIDWKRGKPYIWGKSKGDIDQLLTSDCLFARKFDLNLYPEVINKLCLYLAKCYK